MEGSSHAGTDSEELLSVVQLVETERELRQSVVALQQTVPDQQQTIAELKAGNEQLRQQLKDRDGQHPTQRLEGEYSLEAEDNRSDRKGRRKQKSTRRGRRTTVEKLAQADCHEDVFPEDVSPDGCSLHLSRVVCRIENGQVVLAAYHIYRGPHGEMPTISGTLGRSENGIEMPTDVIIG